MNQTDKINLSKRVAIIFIIAIALTGCGSNVKCIQNELWVNVNPLGFGNIYAPTKTICYEDKD
jgi:uncharacterized protein YceK